MSGPDNDISGNDGPGDDRRRDDRQRDGLPVLVLRPDRQAAATARKLGRLGLRPVVAPILHVEPTADRPPPGTFDALLVTSRSAVRPLADAIGRFPGLPVFAVGRRSGAALAEAGLRDVRAAAGSAADLARLVAETLPAGAALLHAAGRHRKPEPGDTLAGAGFQVAVWECYTAEPADALPDEAAAALRAGPVACLHYSKRSAGTFVRLAGAAGLLGPLTDATHVCLSDDVAFPLRAVGATRIEVAAEPTEAALFDALAAVAADTPADEAGPVSDEAATGSRPGRSGWYARNESGGGRLPGRSRTPPPMTDSSREKRRKDPYSRKAPTIDLKSEDVSRAGTAAAATGKIDGDKAEGPAEPAAPPVVAGATSDEAPFTGIDRPADTAVLGPEPLAPSPDPIPAEAPAEPEAARIASPETPAGTGDATEGEVPVGRDPWPAGPLPTDATPVEPGEQNVTSAASSSPEAGAATLPGAPALETAATGADPAAEPSVLPASPETRGTEMRGTVPPTRTLSFDGDEKPADAPSAAPASPPPRRGAGALLGASLLGGVIGAALAAGATYATRPDTDALAGRLSALERRPAAATPAAPGAAGPDRGALDALAGRLASLETATRPLADGIAAVRGTAQSAEAAARQAAEAASRVQSLPPDPAAAARLDDLGKRLAALDETAKGAASQGAVSALAGQIAPLQESARLGTVNAGAITDLRNRFDTLLADAQARAQASAGTLGTLQTRTGEIDGRVAALQAEQAKLPPALMGAGLRIVAAGQAADALRAGGPLGPALAALAKLGTPAPRLAALQPYATSPAPTAGVLAAEFRPLADRIVSEPARPGDTVTDKLWRMADKIVTVRQVGDGSGTDVPGLVGALESALGRSALGEAAAAWDRLPEAARAASASFGAKLKGRAAADEAARAVASDALGSLDAPVR